MSKKEPKIRVSEDTLRKLEILKYVWPALKSYDEVINLLIQEHDINEKSIHRIELKFLLEDDATIDGDEDDIVPFTVEHIKEIGKDLKNYKIQQAMNELSEARSRLRKLEEELELTK